MKNIREVKIFDSRKNRERVIRYFYIALIVLLVIDFFTPKHGLFPWEEAPGFYAVYGFIGCVSLIFIAKGLRLLVKRKGWEMRSLPQERYDLIFINLPYPSTLQLNRFYTREFFQMAREILAEDGVLVVGAPGILTYMSPELRDLNAVIYETLVEVFPHVRPIPGDYNLFLASPSAEVSAVSWSSGSRSSVTRARRSSSRSMRLTCPTTTPATATGARGLRPPTSSNVA